MTSRDRVKAALDHKEPDAIPLDLNGTGVTGIHVSLVIALREFYGLEKRPVKVHEPYQMLGWVDEDLQGILGVDVAGVFSEETLFGFRNEHWKPWRMDSGQEVLVSAHFQVSKDERGDTLIYPRGDRSSPPSGRMPKDGFFFDTIIRQNTIDEAALDPEDNCEEFGPVSDAALDYFDNESRRAAETGRGVIASFGGTALGDIALVPAPFLPHPKGIRDIEEWYISTLTRRPYIHRVFEKQTALALANLEAIHGRVGDRVDAVFICGADFGTQQSTFFSVDIFRDLFMPYYTEINSWIHKNTPWKTFKHSCGAVGALIPSFIECGFDILNPVQVSAAGMAPERLKREYGEDIVFWGGGVDTQKTLAFGSPEDVRSEVLRRCAVLGKGGGFVFSAVHNIQPNVPRQNIVALFDAVKEFNGQG